MNDYFYPMTTEGNYLLLNNRVMHVPVLEDSDLESNISSEDAGSFTELTELTYSQTPPLGPIGRGATDEVKQELQKAIRCRRVAQGLQEMPSLESNRTSTNQLSDAEVAKRILRRERNKLAAFKCRQRRKEHMQFLEDESNGLHSSNHVLEKEIAALKDQKKELEDMLQTHDCLLIVNSSDDDDEKKSS